MKTTRRNFVKIAGAAGAGLDNPVPNFHLPQFFGLIKFH